MKIGRYCSIAVGINFIFSKHPLNIISTSSFTYDSNFIIFKKARENFNSSFYVNRYRDFIEPDKPTILMDDVYICANACLKPGITLHTGCVVGQNSVVTKDVPPYAIVVGNPGKIVKYRFEEQVIKRLLNLQWWKYKFCDFQGINFYLDQLEKRIERKEIKIFQPKKIFF
ncbi:CatB-related O-acetyltransferase [Campylobacter estrildidarum]|uniref:Acetyltransferase n=1 Tax=Campylobacter estrildidarum TaxID=2510189 RepID=A0A4U7BTD6_9BACT|nr:CatB-related O-acetyltransferase [Campylobacter estrildidarum]TKX32154.1 acetyltransferase [Campylobacter estrildidarum]